MLEREQLQQLYQYGLSLTRDTDDAHDLLQTVLEKWIRQGQKGDVPIAYMRTMMRNQFIDQCRRQQIVAFEPLPDDVLLAMDEQSVEQQHIDSDMVEHLLENLNTAEREVLFLWAVLEYSASEIAQELQTSRGTVLSRLFRVKKKAQEMIQALETPLRLKTGAGL